MLELITVWPRYVAAQRHSNLVVLRIKPPMTSGFTFLAALMLPKVCCLICLSSRFFQRPRVAEGLARHPVQAPVVGDAFQLVLSGVREGEAAARREVFYGRGC
jgi:hypothetical protein